LREPGLAGAFHAVFQILGEKNLGKGKEKRSLNELRSSKSDEQSRAHAHAPQMNRATNCALERLLAGVKRKLWLLLFHSNYLLGVNSGTSVILWVLRRPW
jgi:hypothetical protein